MTKLTELTLAAARDGLASKAFSAVELATAFNAAIEATNPHLNAYVVTTPEKALEMAAASDARLKDGKAWKAFPWASRICSAQKVCAQPPVPTF